MTDFGVRVCFGIPRLGLVSAVKQRSEPATIQHRQDDRRQRNGR
jgi:hypothetical protein